MVVCLSSSLSLICLVAPSQNVFARLLLCKTQGCHTTINLNLTQGYLFLFHPRSIASWWPSLGGFASSAHLRWSPFPPFCRFTVTGELRCSVNHITGTIPDQLGLLQDLGESIVARHWFVVVASRIDPNRSFLCSFIRSFVRSFRCSSLWTQHTKSLNNKDSSHEPRNEQTNEPTHQLLTMFIRLPHLPFQSNSFGSPSQQPLLIYDAIG